VRRAALDALLPLLLSVAPAMAEPVRLAAAGSLRAALTEAAAAFAAPGGAPVEPRFGPSGLLRQRIEGGEPVEVFASANMEHLLALGRALARPAALFARNRMCVIARPGIEVTTETLLERMLDPVVKLGTSTPGADPSGDYAWAIFARAEAVRPGTRAALEAKAQTVVGGPDSPPVPAGRDSYTRQFERGAADMMLAYCTGTAAARARDPSLREMALPDALSMAAEYGLILLSDRPEAARFAMFILSPAGQAALARHGFEAPGLPRTTPEAAARP
jgi:molybdate transport system substrate-binding protein